MDQNNILNSDTKIKLGDTYGQIEEIYGKRKFYLELNKSGLKNFEKRVIIDGKCSCILPMSMLNLEDRERIYFDFTDFIQLSQYRMRSYETCLDGKHYYIIQDAFEMILKILNLFKVCEDHLISLERIPVILDVFFINAETGDLAFAYIPSLSNPGPFRNKIVALIKMIDGLYNDPETSQYFIKLIENIYDKNLGLEGTIGMVDIILREVNYNQWTKIGLRKEFVEEIDNAKDKHNEDERLLTNKKGDGGIRKNTAIGKLITFANQL